LLAAVDGRDFCIGGALEIRTEPNRSDDEANDTQLLKFGIVGLDFRKNGGAVHIAIGRGAAGAGRYNKTADKRGGPARS
jgi:hypothetical protein